jgi:hypothetical protein
MRWIRNVAQTGEKIFIGFWWESQKERDHYEDLVVGGRILLTRSGMDWIDLAQWRALANMVRNHQVL